MSTSYICPPIVVRIPDEDVRVGVPAGLGVMVPVPSGPPGPAGPTGPQGPAGANGVSPVLTVTDIPGGHRITITDATGTKTVDVMDGADAVESVNGQTGVVVLDSTDIDHDNEPISDILGGEQTASGNIVTFTDTTGGNPITALSVEVEPVQNLNGYDNPWPAGGGKNLFEAEVSSSTYAGITATANGDGTFTFNGTATSQFDFYFTDNRQSLANGTYLINGITNGSNSTYRLYAAIYGNTNRYAGLNTGDAEVTLSNETIRLFLRIYNGATLNNVVIKPMIRLATETDSTFAPYSNICPISGWTEAKVTRTGKNILAPGTSRTQQGATYTVNPDGTITVTGTAIASSKCILNSVLLKGGTQYVLSGCPIGGGQGKFGLALYETGTNTILGTDFGSGVTYTPVSDEIIDVGIRYWYGQSPAGTWKPQLEIGSSPTTYEPFSGNTYTIQLGETVYGGTLDVISGTMTVDRAMRTFDGSEDWYFIAFGKNYRAYISVSDIDSTTPDTQIANLVCNQFKAMSYSTGGFRTGISGRYQISQINVFQNIFTTVSDWKNHLEENPLQVCYELATPIELALTPTQIQTLVGENVVWSDAGDVALSVSTGLIGAVETIPTKTSDLTNDSGFVNATQAAAAAPVQSVNGRTGAVIVKALHFTVSITELPCTVTDSRITADMRLIEAVLGTPSAVTTDLGWTTAAGSIVFSGTLASGGSTTLDFDLIEVLT